MNSLGPFDRWENVLSKRRPSMTLEEEIRSLRAALQAERDAFLAVLTAHADLGDEGMRKVLAWVEARIAAGRGTT